MRSEIEMEGKKGEFTSRLLGSSRCHFWIEIIEIIFLNKSSRIVFSCFYILDKFGKCGFNWVFIRGIKAAGGIYILSAFGRAEKSRCNLMITHQKPPTLPTKKPQGKLKWTQSRFIFSNLDFGQVNVVDLRLFLCLFRVNLTHLVWYLWLKKRKRNRLHL